MWRAIYTHSNDASLFSIYYTTWILGRRKKIPCLQWVTTFHLTKPSTMERYVIGVIVFTLPCITFLHFSPKWGYLNNKWVIFFLKDNLKFSRTNYSTRATVALSGKRQVIGNERQKVTAQFPISDWWMFWKGWRRLAPGRRPNKKNCYLFQRVIKMEPLSLPSSRSFHFKANIETNKDVGKEKKKQPLN